MEARGGRGLRLRGFLRTVRGQSCDDEAADEKAHHAGGKRRDARRHEVGHDVEDGRHRDPQTEHRRN
ncbi:hypothetical protein D3C83_168750 [compost metagenome]